jgi:hypothetical protein
MEIRHPSFDAYSLAVVKECSRLRKELTVHALAKKTEGDRPSIFCVSLSVNSATACRAP